MEYEPVNARSNENLSFYATGRGPRIARLERNRTGDMVSNEIVFQLSVFGLAT